MRWIKDRDISEWGKEIINCVPPKPRACLLKLQLIFQDHAWLNWHWLFQVPLFLLPPLKRLNHPDVFGRSCEKRVFCFYVSFDVTRPQIFVNLSTLKPDYSNFLPSPNPILRTPPWIDLKVLSFCQAAVFWADFTAPSSSPSSVSLPLYASSLSGSKPTGPSGRDLAIRVMWA